MLVFDIEANGFIENVTEIHCIVTQDTNTEKVMKYHDYFSMPRDASLEAGVHALKEAQGIIGHNIEGYDIPVLEMLTSYETRFDQIRIDTMLLSCILHSSMRKNGLEDWFIKLGLPVAKVKITDFSNLTDELLRRCVNDVRGNKMLYDHLAKETRDLNKAHSDVLHIGDALQLEQDVSRIHSKQVRHGIYYDIPYAEVTFAGWEKRSAKLAKEIHEGVPKTCKMYGSVEVKKPFKKDGTASKALTDWFPDEDDQLNVRGQFTRIEFENINLNSDQQVKNTLLKLGWQPTQWNYKIDPAGQRVRTSPKLTEDSFESLPEGLGKVIADFNILKHRRSLFVSQRDPNQGSLPMAKANPVEGTTLGLVRADAFTCGTNTARYAHVKPVANLPRPSSKYGYPCRRIFVPPPGAIQIGVDLSGVEARKLCDLCYPYPGGEEFAEMVLHGDWHSENASIWRVSRDTAKTILYAMMYGAGDEKLGKTAGGSAARGAGIKEAFLEANPAYACLVEDLTDAYNANGGWIPSIDGRPLYPKSKKDTLNTKIQGDCAVLFKHWMRMVDKLQDVQQGHAHQMVAYHDELQFAYCTFNEGWHPECFAQKVVQCAVLTGEQYELNVPLDAEYSIGYSYAATH